MHENVLYASSLDLYLTLLNYTGWFEESGIQMSKTPSKLNSNEGYYKHNLNIY